MHAGYSSSPSFPSGLTRNELLEMAPRGFDSPRLQRTHSAVHRSESSHSGGLPSRSGSYRYVDVRIRDESPVYARDDSYLYNHGHGHLYNHGYHRQGSGSDKEFLYASQSETYNTPHRTESFTPPLLNLREGSFHDQPPLNLREGSFHDQPPLNLHEGSFHDHPEKLYSPASNQSQSSSNYRQEQLYSPVLNMSKHDFDRTQYISSASSAASSRDSQSEKLFSPVLSGSGEQECLAFSQDIVGKQTGGGNTSPSPNKPKLRFPRTNPTYVGVSKRDGQTAYKKINVNQKPHFDLGATDEQVSPAMQTSQIHPEYFDTNFYRHERSDSDGSYSSPRAYRHDRTDSQASQSPLRSRDRDLSDSQSSQGSMRNMSDVQSSEGSLRNMQDSAVSFQDSVSSRGSNRSTSNNREIIGHERSGSQYSKKSLDLSENDSEPEYANLPVPPPPTQTIELSPDFVNEIEQNNLKNVLRERNSIIETEDLEEFVRNEEECNGEIDGREVNGRSEEQDQLAALLMQTSQFSEGIKGSINSDNKTISYSKI